MHQFTKDMEVLQQAIVRYSVERVRMDPPELDAPLTPEQLTAMTGQTITEHGLGGLEALFGTPREASWIALGHLGAPPEATRDIGGEARTTMQGVWGLLTDTVNSICNQFTDISYQLLRL